MNSIYNLETIQRNTILAAYQAHKWNQRLTAKALGISIETLKNRSDRYQAQGYEILKYVKPRNSIYAAR